MHFINSSQIMILFNDFIYTCGNELQLEKLSFTLKPAMKYNNNLHSHE